MLIKKDGVYKKTVDKPFKNETELQQMIESNPEIVPWEMHEKRIVAREFETKAGSIDNLILDANGQIIVLETKLFRNKSRREVLGQILDYTAQLTKYPPLAFIDAMSRTTGRKFMKDWFSDEESKDAFLRELEQNLMKGSFTMIIAMDTTDYLLKDAVAYLNRSTEFNCLLAEMRLSCVGDEEGVNVTLYGEESIREKRPKESRVVQRQPRIDESAFLANKREMGLEAEGLAFVQALRWASENATNEKGTLRSTPKSLVLGVGNDCINWAIDDDGIDIWSSGEIFEERYRYFRTIKAPWSKRITLFPFTKKKSTFGKLARVDVKDATVSEFKELFRFFFEGP